MGTLRGGNQTIVSSLKERTGSKKDIIDPIFSQMKSVNEIIGKGLENRLWERVDNMAKLDSNVAARFEKIEPIPAVDGEGNISFPQERDPGIIRFFKNGKREFRKVAPEFQALAKVLRPKEFDALSFIYRIPASVFIAASTFSPDRN